MVTAFTVPAGKRWRLKVIQGSNTAGNSQALISDGTIQIALTQSGTTCFLVPAEPIECLAGWTIGRSTTGNGGDIQESMALLIEEVDTE